MKDHVAVLVPCYNESKTIEKVVRDFKRVLPEATVYVYDNNSSDGTGEIAARAGAVVRRERMQGKGSVIRRMFREIDADCYLMVDGDDTYPAEDAPAMVSAVLDEQADMVVGDRLSSTYFTENKRPFHNLGNGLVRASINHLFGSDIKDIMTGYRAFNAVFAKTMPVLSEGFQIETEISIHAVDKRWRIEDVPIDYRDRPEGSYSKLSTFGDGAKVLKAITSLFKDYRPLAFFGWLALILLVLAVVAGIPVVAEYAATGLVPRIPTMLGSLALAGCGALSFVTGLILDTVAKSHRRQWEIDVYKAMNGFYRE